MGKGSRKGTGNRKWSHDQFQGSPDTSNYETSYYGHDDRDRAQGSGRLHNNKRGRKVSFVFKHGAKRPGINIPKHKLKSLIDEDDDMGESSRETTYRGRSDRGGKFHGRRGGMRGDRGVKHYRLQDQNGFFRVVLPYAAKHDKNIIFNVLRTHISPLQIIPIAYRREDNHAVFYVDDIKVAQALADADRKIHVPGLEHNLGIKVNSGFPKVDMTDALKERIKNALVKRYNADNKALDLEKLHRDPDLVEDSFCTISRAPVLHAVVDILSEYIPQLEALNLEGNNLYAFETLKSIPMKLPHIKILYLGNNRIKDNSGLSVLKNLQLVELKLKGNPLCDHFKSNEAYTSAIRKIFTQLKKLDDVELPPLITFEEQDTTINLPASQASFFCNEGGKNVARTFIEQYYIIYDTTSGGTRQPLMDAYHENATFTLSCSYPYQRSDGPRLNDYLPNARNLLRAIDDERKIRLVKSGKIAIVGLLSEMPKTEHDPNSFTLDMAVCSQSLLTITLTGLFREPETKYKPIRFFTRKFILVPQGGGYCIINEMLYITNASARQFKNAFKPPQIIVSPSTPTATITSPAAVAVTPTSPPQLTLEQQNEFINAVSLQTSMNQLWARKCLEETHWNVQQALFAFKQLNDSGKIPMEAFQKI